MANLFEGLTLRKENMKTKLFYITGSIPNLFDLAIEWANLSVHEWKEKIERYCNDNRIGSNFEVRTLERLGKRMAMNVYKYDSLPYGEFLDAMHAELQKVEFVGK
jgi:hypothetical protein